MERDAIHVAVDNEGYMHSCLLALLFLQRVRVNGIYSGA